MDGYILKYLYDRTSNSKERRFLDYFKIFLDHRLYSYGMHHLDNFENNQRRYLEIIEQDKGIKQFLHPRRKLREIREKLSILLSSYKKKECSVTHILQDGCRYHVLSLLNLPKETVNELKRNSIAVYHYGSPCFVGDVMYSSNSLDALNMFVQQLRYYDFNQLLSEDNYNRLEYIYQKSIAEFRNKGFDAVFTKTSETLECKFIIDVFREIGIPSITLQHGIPGYYTVTTESRASYLCVWGENVRKNYLNTGFDMNKIFVSGNSNYTSFPIHPQIRCDLQNVLVITSTPFEVHQHEWQWNKFPKQDRELLITYLYSVENVLKSNGIQRARLRPHPHHINRKWLEKYIDMNFYEMDNADLISSLSKATMCIGQPSSSMFEALRNGVSYLVYEPSEDGKHSMSGEILVPPYDGSDKKLKIASSEKQLDQMIKNRYVIDVKLLDEYIMPFNGAIIKQILDD